VVASRSRIGVAVMFLSLPMVGVVRRTATPATV
jgi:hypothetical protein